MNRRTQRKFMIDWKATHGKYERWVLPYFKRALDSQVRAVINSIEDQGIFLVEGFLSRLIQNGSMQEAYQRAYERVGIAHGKWTTGWMTELEDSTKSRFLKKQVDFGSEFWRRQMRDFLLIYGAEKIAEVDAFTVDRIRRLIARTAEENLTISEQATKIVDILKSPNYNRARALRIARTESMMAANQVAKTAGENAEYQTEKVWISIIDGRERPSHGDMNGVAVALDESFNVGGKDMDRPGDPNASAANVVSCRCSIAIQPIFDSNGIPVPK